MSTIWYRVEQLQGKTLHTLIQRKEFQVVSVEPDLLEVLPRNGKRRRVERRRIEEVAEMRLDQDGLSPGRLSRDFPKNGTCLTSQRSLTLSNRRDSMSKSRCSGDNGSAESQECSHGVGGDSSGPLRGPGNCSQAV